MIESICRWLVKKYNKGQSTFCYCPKCGLELCNSKSWFSDSDLVRYKCVQCGHRSGWLFDAPCPILVEGRILKNKEAGTSFTPRAEFAIESPSRAPGDFGYPGPTRRIREVELPPLWSPSMDQKKADGPMRDDG